MYEVGSCLKLYVYVYNAWTAEACRQPNLNLVAKSTRVWVCVYVFVEHCSLISPASAGVFFEKASNREKVNGDMILELMRAYLNSSGVLPANPS